MLGVIDSNAYPIWWLGQFREQLGKLKQFLSVSPEEWQRAQNPNPQYLTCWSVTHFLFHYQDGRYKKGFLTYIEGTKKGKTDLATFETLIGPIDTLETEWLAYLKNLKIE